MQLSKRLLACCQYVQPGDRVADIGCDHGYLSLHLLQNHIASSVIAADINEGPLRSAMVNAEKFGVIDNIRFYLSDGVQSIPREFDRLICAGMGGDTMISILEAAPWLRNSQYAMVLQCQSKTAMLWQYLADKGWQIQDETVVRDGRFLYTVMSVIWQKDSYQLTAGQLHFSPALLNHPDEDTAEYFQRQLFSLRRANLGRGEHADPQMLAAQAELEALEAQNTWLKELTQWQP